ncbi:hypothetical protein BS50DRAFT_581313 [Corynespora cassiicola Philippines]|uniref:Uncharacterized protein n=1 Tax=Corynespora cassiicola Philippines TaxID=1448308 RepID=A0A2T2PA27_CORCC|nr:hypothetical protein BS50DRAFT_581313 [Corynespora cassiicola Philippines]
MDKPSIMPINMDSMMNLAKDPSIHNMSLSSAANLSSMDSKLTYIAKSIKVIEDIEKTWNESYGSPLLIPKPITPIAFDRLVVSIPNSAMRDLDDITRIHRLENLNAGRGPEGLDLQNIPRILERILCLHSSSITFRFYEDNENGFHPDDTSYPYAKHVIEKFKLLAKGNPRVKHEDEDYQPSNMINAERIEIHYQEIVQSPGTEDVAADMASGVDSLVWHVSVEITSIGTLAGGVRFKNGCLVFDKLINIDEI